MTAFTGPLAGDDLVPEANVVMDREFVVPGDPVEVWPWLVQLGKGRAGWYLPWSIERFLPRRNRALREIDPQWQSMAVGDRIPDYGPNGSFGVAALSAPDSIVFTSTRGHTRLTWSINLTDESPNTRVRLRLRLGVVKRVWLAESVGDWFDAVTVAGMAAGLRERLKR